MERIKVYKLGNIKIQETQVQPKDKGKSKDKNAAKNNIQQR